MSNQPSARIRGHLFALFTVLVWGTTLVATKNLVNAGLQPVEIIFYRFFLGWLCLFLLKPRGFRFPTSLATLKQERWLILSGISAIPVYFMLENTAVVYSTASNTSLLVTMSPLFMALLSFFVLKNGQIKKSFVLGALVCFAGVFLVVFNGNVVLELNPLGDFLAITASFFWAIYSLIGERMSRDNFPDHIIIRMQRVFFYGLLVLLPLMPLFGFRFEPARLLLPGVLAQLAYLGLVASALSFITWNMAIGRMGALSTGLYIYLIPVITITFSMIFLDERLTPMSAVGALLIVCGLMVAEGWFQKRKQNETEQNQG